MVEEQQKKREQRGLWKSIHPWHGMDGARESVDSSISKKYCCRFYYFFQWSVLLVQTTYMKEIQFGIRKKILETNNSSGIASAYWAEFG